MVGCNIISFHEAAEFVKDGMTVMVGGFITTGTPPGLMDVLVEKDVKALTVICNDTGFPDKGVGRLIHHHLVKKIMFSHCGTNSEAQQQMLSGEMEAVFVPQGTLIEKIRAGGAGLGGVLVTVGLGTIVEQGKPRIEVDGKLYILEKPIRANVALIKAHQADEKGNLIYRYGTRNFNQSMATAADIVIAEVDEILPVGSLHPDSIMTPGVFVDYLVLGKGEELQ